MTTRLPEPDSAPGLLCAGRVLGPDGWLSPGWLRIEDGRLTGVGSGTISGATDLGSGTVIAPGLVDMHCHGGGGAAFTEGADAARIAAAAHLRHGTTTVIGSLVTDSVADLTAQVAALTPLVDAGELGGVHLEGPWLSPLHRGAHDPELLAAPEPVAVQQLLSAGPVRMVTIAPELPGALEAIRMMREHGVVVAVGHTDADHATVLAALEAGASVATHLFNAERGLHHREPGPVAALLESGATIELIADGVHVHPCMLALARRAATGPIALITDAMAAAAAEDGDYRLGPLRVRVTGGVARVVQTDAIAGSTLTLLDAVRFAINQAGFSVSVALQAASTAPAEALSLDDVGALAPGRRADLIVLDTTQPSLPLRRVMRAGRWVH